MNKKDKHYTRNKFQNSNTFKTIGGEKNDGKSITVQDEAYTIKELLEKHVQGLMPNVGLNPEYDTEEPSLDDDMLFRKQNLDLTDIDDIKKKVEKTAEKVKKQRSKTKDGTSNPDRSSIGKDGTQKTQRSGEHEV